MLQHGGNESIFDSAAMIQTHCIAYVSFYSDVEHEVTAVTSGYRVTLTYNLFFSTGPTNLNNSAPTIPTPSTTEIAFERALSMLLSGKTFMEQGGFPGFGLQHKYPLNPSIISREVTRSYRECVASSASQPISGSSTKIVISETSVSCYALALFVNVLAYFQDMEGLINVL